MLFIIPACIALYLYSLWLHKKQRALLGDKALIKALMPNQSTLRKHIKFSLLMLALCAAIVVIARPQYGLKQQTDTANGIEAVVMIDVSNSMLANDITPSRLDRAKLLVTNMVDKMKNDKIALGVFAGEAYPQLPITSDYASAKIFIDALSTNMVTMQGTDIAAAIDLGCQSFTDKKMWARPLYLLLMARTTKEALKTRPKKQLKRY